MIDLSNRKNCVSYSKGETIYKEGCWPTGIYCLCKGLVKIFKTGINGKEQILRFIIPGDIFGLKTFISDQPYSSSSASILEDSHVCFINKCDILSIIKKYPDIYEDIIVQFCKLLEEVETNLLSLAQKCGKKRLAEALLSIHNAYNNNCTSCDILISREDLANIVGTSCETIIRLLSKFKEEKLIKIKGRRITLIDIDGLVQKAEIEKKRSILLVKMQ
ncbi:MAG: Crp/Fnr family transcriptional regulator [Bacteroidetes bacterium]|nr:Crp/Fnr family transcriptional regulator [Bacteroidota bacterium]